MGKFRSLVFPSLLSVVMSIMSHVRGEVLPTSSILMGNSTHTVGRADAIPSRYPIAKHDAVACNAAKHDAVACNAARLSGLTEQP